MSFASETPVKAVRKRKACDGCGRHIEIGEPAIRWAGLTDGDFGTAIYHPDCREAELAYNNDLLECQWGDDWYPIHEIDRDDWPWLIEAHPTVAARMGIAAPSVCEAPQVEREGSRDEQNPSASPKEVR